MLAKRDKDCIVVTSDDFIKLIEDASVIGVYYSVIGNYKVIDPLFIDYTNSDIKTNGHIIFTKCDFDELVLKNVYMRCCHFIDIRVKKLKLVNCSIEQCVFTTCIIDEIEMYSSSMSLNTMSKCNVIGGNSGYIEHCFITENMMTDFVIHSDVIFSNTFITNNYIIDCLKHGCGKLAFMNCSITKNKLCKLTMHHLYFYKCEAFNNITSMCLLDDMESYESTVILNEVCPEEGSFIGYKKVWYLDDLSSINIRSFSTDQITEYIAVLEIPEDAKRSSGGSDKCRADKVKVLRLEDMDGNEVKDAVGYSIIGLQSLKNRLNMYDTVLTQRMPICKYQAGEMIYADSFDENKFNTCSNGIHFFISKDRARQFNN